MNKLSKKEREALVAGGALILDDEGDETFRGLTVAESNFILNVERGQCDDFDLAELRLYSQLRAKHCAARADSAALLVFYHRLG